MPPSTELDALVDKIVNDHSLSEPGQSLKELGDNGRYIMDVQMKKLLKLHDQSFIERCFRPMEELKNRYAKVKERSGDLQKEAELVDRDIRIIEMAIQDINKNKSHQ